MSHGNEIDRLMESDPIELVNRLLAAESRATTAEQENERLRRALLVFDADGSLARALPAKEARGA